MDIHGFTDYIDEHKVVWIPGIDVAVGWFSMGQFYSTTIRSSLPERDQQSW